MSEQPTTPTPRPRRRALRDVVQTLLLAVGMYVAVQFFVLPYEVDGASMDPRLHNGDRLLVNRNAYVHFDANDLWNMIPGVEREGDARIYPFHAPERGDVIVFDPPRTSDKPYIKRVVGLPGERVTFRGGNVFIDGEPLDESYIDGPITDCNRGAENCNLGPIPDGYVFVLGDNRAHSQDSRSFGLVAVERIIGQAFFVNWPPADLGPL